MDDLTPLPAWRQRWNAHRDRWKKTRNRRKQRLAAFASLARRGLTLAISGTGATLVAIGVYQVFAPAGWIAGGLLLWAVQWNHGDRGEA